MALVWCSIAKSGLTKRAPDVWDSAAFSSIFLASSFFLLPNRVHARPHAGTDYCTCQGSLKDHFFICAR